MKIKLNPFDKSSIRNAISEVHAYQKKVEELGPDLTKRLTEDGVQQAKDLAMYMGAYDSGELVNGIIPEYRKDKGYVVSTAYHSAFVEMGTGIRGEKSPNPNKYASGWKYDVNHYGEAGWEYIGKDGRKHWTTGMPHRPFMYETYTLMKDAAPVIAKDMLGDDEK